MKVQAKKSTLTPTNKIEEKTNFHKAVALLVASKQQRKSTPSNNTSISKQEFQNTSHEAILSKPRCSDPPPLSQAPLNHSFNKSNSHYLPHSHSSLSTTHALAPAAGSLPFSTSNSATVAVTTTSATGNISVGDSRFANSNFSQQQEQGNFPQNFELPTTVLSLSQNGSYKHQLKQFLSSSSSASATNWNAQNPLSPISQTRPSLSQNKLNQLLLATRTTPTNPNSASNTLQKSPSKTQGFTEQSIDGSFSAFQSIKNPVNPSSQSSGFTASKTPSGQQAPTTKSSLKQNYVNPINPAAQVTQTLQNVSPQRKTRQSLETKIRPILTEGNASKYPNTSNSPLNTNQDSYIFDHSKERTSNKQTGSSLGSQSALNKRGGSSTTPTSVGQTQNKSKHQSYFQLNSFLNSNPSGPNAYNRFANNSSTISPSSVKKSNSRGEINLTQPNSSSFCLNNQSGTLPASSNSIVNPLQLLLGNQPIPPSLNHNNLAGQFQDKNNRLMKSKQTSLSSSQNTPSGIRNFTPLQSTTAQPSISGDTMSSGANTACSLAQNSLTAKGSVQNGVAQGNLASMLVTNPSHSASQHQKNSKSVSLSKNSFTAHFNTTSSPQAINNQHHTSAQLNLKTDSQQVQHISPSYSSQQQSLYSSNQPPRSLTSSSSRNDYLKSNQPRHAKTQILDLHSLSQNIDEQQNALNSSTLILNSRISTNTVN